MSGEAPSDRARELRALHRRIPVSRHASLFLHWMSRWWRPPRPARHEPVPRAQPGQVAIAFGGHATALVRYAGLDIAFDPMLGRWLGGVRRAQEPGLAAGDLDEVGLVLISHRHKDHLHLPTLARLPRRATIVVPPGGAAVVSPLGFARVVEIAAGGDVEMRGVQIHATPMAHGDAPEARGLSYVVRGDGPSVFLCGDGAYFSGFADVGARFAPDVALLPIAGFVPASFRARHMSPLDALYAFEDLHARLMIPIHHGAFALSYERLGEPARWLGQLVKERGLDGHVHVLQPGESEVFVAPRGARDGADDEAAPAVGARHDDAGAAADADAAVESAAPPAGSAPVVIDTAPVMMEAAAPAPDTAPTAAPDTAPTAAPIAAPSSAFDAVPRGAAPVMLDSAPIGADPSDTATTSPVHPIAVAMPGAPAPARAPHARAAHARDARDPDARDPDTDARAEAATTPRMPSALGALLREIAVEEPDAVPVYVEGESPSVGSARVLPLPA